MTVPLLPFLLFRNDSFAVLLAVAGLLAVVHQKETKSLVLLGAGILAKGWPVTWAIAEGWRRRRGRALVLIGIGLSAGAILLSPAVQSIQDPNGIHSETLGGSVTGFLRALKGEEQRFLPSSALYMDAPRWLLLVQVSIGAAICIKALAGIRGQKFSWSAAWRLTGALTTALILGSYLFSTQFVYWITPFAAADRRATRVMLAVNVASLILLSTWNELFDGPVWWWGLLVARNLLVIVTGFQLATFVGRRVPKLASRSQTPSAEAPS
jgi:hypothetical protein